MSPAKVRLLLNRFGLVILVLGLSSAAWIWYAQDRIDRQDEAQAVDPAAPLDPLDSRKHVRDVEIYYGNLGVLMEKAEAALHGKGLAKTLAVVSTLGATSLFLVAARMAPTATRGTKD